MSMVLIKELVWDDFNFNHIVRHEVTKAEVEEACLNIMASFKSRYGRLLVMGQTRRGRMLSLVLDYIKEGVYYLVTARDSSRKERRYLNEKNKK